MTMGPFVIHEAVVEKGLDGTIDFDNDTFTARLCTSASNAATQSLDDVTGLTNELSGNGYAAQTLANVTFSQTSGVAEFSCDPIQFTASGGDLVFRYLVINSSATGTPIIGHMLVDDTPADRTVPDGVTYIVTPDPTNGLFQVTRS